MSTTHSYDRLPQWAQIELRNLRASVARLEAERNAGPEDTDTFVDHVTRIHDGPENRFQRLPRGAEIVFWDQPGWPTTEVGRITVRWNDRLQGIGRPGLDIRSAGAGQMIITPHSSNVIYVYEDDR